jgi:hypothetical protein
MRFVWDDITGHVGQFFEMKLQEKIEYFDWIADLHTPAPLKRGTQDAQAIKRKKACKFKLCRLSIS